MSETRVKTAPNHLNLAICGSGGSGAGSALDPLQREKPSLQQGPLAVPSRNRIGNEGADREGVQKPMKLPTGRKIGRIRR